MDKVIIAGVGGNAQNLLPETRKAIENADVLFGTKRILDMFCDVKAERIPFKNPKNTILDVKNFAKSGKKVVILASGDPNFNGVADYVRREIGKENVCVLPHLSSVQLAFTRIGEKWDDAALTTIHARPIEDSINVIIKNRKTAILTDNEHTPAKLAEKLIEAGFSGLTFYVCEELETENEKVHKLRLEQVPDKEFSELNVVIVINEKTRTEKDSIFGNNDSLFEQEKPFKGLITKKEVRAISLAQMGLKADSVIWDIGAGSGAIAIEASKIASLGKVFAVEQHTNRVEQIKANIKTFNAFNVSILEGKASKVCPTLPEPDAVFIGGSSGEMDEVLEIARGKLKTGGKIIVNSVTLENLNKANSFFEKNGFSKEILTVNISRSKNIGGLTSFESLTPIFITTATKGE